MAGQGIPAQTGISKVVVCGGGHGAHAMVATLAARTPAEIVWFLPYGDECARVQRALEDGSDGPSGLAAVGTGEKFFVEPQRLVISNDPATAARAELVLLVVPAFAHRPLLQSLGIHLSPETVIGAIPARGGFQYEVSDRTSFGLQTLPWACRLEVFGRRVRILAEKEKVLLGSRPVEAGPALARLLTDWLGIPVQARGGLTAMTLANIGQVLHPGLMYVHLCRLAGAFPRRADRTAIAGAASMEKGDPAAALMVESEIPYFYRDAGEDGAALLAAMSGEIMSLRRSLEEAMGPGLDLTAAVDVFTWLKQAYAGDIEDDSSLARALATNRAYRGIRLPVLEVSAADASGATSGQETRYRADLGSRYLTEDVPFGLVVTRGLAELAGVATPTIDLVLERLSRWMGKEYLRGGRLAGADVTGSRAPQRYGMQTLAEALAGETAGRQKEEERDGTRRVRGRDVPA